MATSSAILVATTDIVVLRRVKAATRSKHGADIAERGVSGAVHDGYEAIALQKGRKLLVGDTLFRKARQQRRGHQDESDFRRRQALVDSSHHRHAEAEVFFAEPDLDTSCYEQVVQFFWQHPTCHLNRGRGSNPEGLAWSPLPFRQLRGPVSATPPERTCTAPS